MTRLPNSAPSAVLYGKSRNCVSHWKVLSTTTVSFYFQLKENPGMWSQPHILPLEKLGRVLHVKVHPYLLHVHTFNIITVSESLEFDLILKIKSNRTFTASHLLLNSHSDSIPLILKHFTVLAWGSATCLCTLRVITLTLPLVLAWGDCVIWC